MALFGSHERRPSMRAMFLIYTVGIFAGLTYFIVIGLTHH
jgi:hypothetical protein